MLKKSSNAIAVLSFLGWVVASSLTLGAGEASARETVAEVTATTSVIAQNPAAENVKSAFSDQVEVELLKVHRIENPETGARDIVNVRFRLRRLVDNVGQGGRIYAYRSLARNPENSQEFRGMQGNSSGVIILKSLPINTWGEAHVWLPVPEELDVIDLVLHNTETFERVRIDDAVASHSPENAPQDATSLVHSAFSNQVEVELLEARRIENPDTGVRDLVNVKFQTRRLVDRVGEGGRMYTYRSVARHPDTNQAFRGKQSNSSGVIVYNSMPVNEWKEAYVWIPIPESVSVVDLAIHNTALFENVDILD